MTAAGKILAYIGFVLVGGAFLAPPLWWGGRWLVAIGAFPELDPFPFTSYFNRAILVVALLSLVPFLRWLGVRSWRDLGLTHNPRRLWDALLGFGLAVVAVWVMVAALAAVGYVQWTGGWSWGAVGFALATGAVVAGIEEPLFRGALLGALRRQLAWPLALLLLTAVFAVLHFLKPNPAAQAAEIVDWWAGFRLIPHAFWQFDDLQLVTRGLVVLVLIGWALGYAVIRTQSLYFSIALHAGLVFSVKLFPAVARRADTTVSHAWMGEHLTVGYGAVAVGAALVVLVTWFMRRRREHQRPGAVGAVILPVG